MRNLVIAALVAVSSAGTAGAATYDAVGDFSLSPSPVWNYGKGIGGVAFSAFTNNTTDCYGQGFSCRFSSDYQGAGVGSGGAFGTVQLDPAALWLHPADGAGAKDTIVQFTAPTTSSYSVSGFFERLSTVPSGNGVNVSIYRNTSAIFFSTALNGTPAYGTHANFLGAYALAAGDTLSFVVNNNGSYGYDSTGLAAQITAVPEPATWALMIGGFGMAGAAMRTRRKASVSFA